MSKNLNQFIVQYEPYCRECDSIFYVVRFPASPNYFLSTNKEKASVFPSYPDISLIAAEIGDTDDTFSIYEKVERITYEYEFRPRGARK